MDDTALQHGPVAPAPASELEEFSILELEERLEFAVSCDGCNNNCSCPPPPPQ